MITAAANGHMTAAGYAVIYFLLPLSVLVAGALIIALPRLFRAQTLQTEALRRVLRFVEPEEGPSLATQMALMRDQLDRIDRPRPWDGDDRRNPAR